MNFWMIVKKNLMKRGKKMLNTKLERHMTEPRALPHEVCLYIYIYIYIESQVFYFGNSETMRFI